MLRKPIHELASSEQGKYEEEKKKGRKDWQAAEII